MADMNYVSPLTSDLTDYYTKSEVDELQQGDAATYATSAEIVAGDNAVKGWVVSQGFLTEHQDLTNYATISYVDDAIAAIEPSSGGMAVRVVNTLPAVGEENVLYLVFVDNEDEENRYAEYIWSDTLNGYEMLGYGTGEGVMPDLTNYATKSYVDTAVGAIVVPDVSDFIDAEKAASIAADEVEYKMNTLSTVAVSGSYDDLTDKPTIPAAPDLSSYATKSELSAKANAADLATVATSGSYNDLSNKPTIPSTSGLASETYVDNAIAAIKGSDIDNDMNWVDEPMAKAFAIDEINNNVSAAGLSGDYDDLTNKPTIPVLPTLATVATSGDYNDLSNKPTIPDAGIEAGNILASMMLVSPGFKDSVYSNIVSVSTAEAALEKLKKGYCIINGSGSTVSLSNINANLLFVITSTGHYQMAAVSNPFSFTTDIALILAGKYLIKLEYDSTNSSWTTGLKIYLTQRGLSTVAVSGDYDDLINKPTIPTLPTLATVATSGSYNDLTDKPTIPAAPDLTPYATKQELTAKADSASLASVATSGSYNDLSDKPIIPSGGINQIYASIINPFNIDVNVLNLATFGVVYNSTIENHMNEAKTAFLNAIKNGKWIKFSAAASGGTLKLSNTDLGLANNRTIYLYAFNYSTKTWQGSQGYQLNLNTDRVYGYINNGIFVSYPADVYEYGGSLKYLPYYNTTSGLTATTIQGAIDELAAASGGGSSVGYTYDSTTKTVSLSGVSDDNL